MTAGSGPARPRHTERTGPLGQQARSSRPVAHGKPPRPVRTRAQNHLGHVPHVHDAANAHGTRGPPTPTPFPTRRQLFCTHHAHHQMCVHWGAQRCWREDRGSTELMAQGLEWGDRGWLGCTPGGRCRSERGQPPSTAPAQTCTATAGPGPCGGSGAWKHTHAHTHVHKHVCTHVHAHSRHENAGAKSGGAQVLNYVEGEAVGGGVLGKRRRAGWRREGPPPPPHTHGLTCPPPRGRQARLAASCRHGQRTADSGQPQQTKAQKSHAQQGMQRAKGWLGCTKTHTTP